MMRGAMIAVALAAGATMPAFAQDQVVDAGQPASFVEVLQQEGYKAALKKDKEGAPLIESAANGESFTISFFNCNPVKGCTSAQFYTWYKKKPWFDAALANRWNDAKRFLKVSIDSEGDLSVFMDVSLQGKLTYANLADVIDWWAVMTGDLDKFMAGEEKAAETK
jgi:hypothetical protein